MRTTVWRTVVSLAVLLTPLAGWSQGYSIQQVPFTSVSIRDHFWAPRLKSHAQTTLRICIAQMRDSTQRIANFERAAGLKSGGHQGIFFDDSDVYKAMEGMAYSLQHSRDPEIEAVMDHWTGLIAKAQQPDGYINTYFTLDHPQDEWGDKGRWTDVGRHEMYCGGHLIEAGVAYHKATGKRTLLDVGIRFANHWLATFGPGKRHWVEGHQEPELALVKLYHATNDKRYLDFAHWLLEERGHGHEKGPMWDANPNARRDIQTEVPVKDLADIKGHAVRATYLFTGMADVLATSGDKTYQPALLRVWDDVVLRNMYITGGIGSSATNEGFVEDYDLPNKTAYSETCASIGMVLWNSRMNLLSGEAKYADVMERAMNNAVLAGVSLAGDRFFYVNPLESDGAHHRQSWFGCACCPSNISRFLPSVGNYVYAQKKDELLVNLYMASETRLQMGATPVGITQETDYPWEGRIRLTVNPETAVNGKIKLRIPGWCKTYSVHLNGRKINPKKLDAGYWTLDRTWKKGDVITLDLDMPVEVVAADPRVRANVGKRAIQRGPLVYCLEQTDNPGIDLNTLKISATTRYSVSNGNGMLRGMKLVQTTVAGKPITYVPYYAWDNREAGKMMVWVDYTD
ncbi:glycoside hydrolase family 127 protein [Larkinella insperata]|uniref:Glycoside hydrolase family 127 protein n=1 Tax=Larkinella insperata TaxID=332158 RepID=A0ABW3QAM5_9BACT